MPMPLSSPIASVASGQAVLHSAGRAAVARTPVALLLAVTGGLALWLAFPPFGL